MDNLSQFLNLYTELNEEAQKQALLLLQGITKENPSKTENEEHVNVNK